MNPTRFRPDPNLSFIIKVNGEIVPAMPDDAEFSIQELRDYVAGPPEFLCETRDGFLQFHNKESRNRNLGLNEAATALYPQPPDKIIRVYGRVFLAHPAHVAPYWRKYRSS